MPQQDAAGSSPGAEETGGLTGAQQAPHTDNTLSHSGLGGTPGAHVKAEPWGQVLGQPP